MKKYEKLLQLDEGKKQALQVLKKNLKRKVMNDFIYTQSINERISDEELFEEIIKRFQTHDPTKQGKYLETFMYVLTKNIASISQFLATLELMGIKRKLEIIEKKNIKINLNDKAF